MACMLHVREGGKETPRSLAQVVPRRRAGGSQEPVPDAASLWCGWDTTVGRRGASGRGASGVTGRQAGPPEPEQSSGGAVG